MPPSASFTSPVSEPIEVFVSYSHRDEGLKDELYVHLANLIRQNKIKPWQDRAIEAGTEWDAEIKARLESADVILLLITPRFIASEYCFDKEMKRAIALLSNRELIELAPDGYRLQVELIRQWFTR